MNQLTNNTADAATRQADLDKSWAHRLFILLCVIQGFYYLLTGIWSLVDIESFQWVTGPKTDHLVTGLEADHWLVKTVGVLVAVIGSVLLLAAWRQQRPSEVVLLAVGSAIGLTAIDIIYVFRGAIAPIYLLDAVAEVALLAGWALVWRWQTESKLLLSARFRPQKVEAPSSFRHDATTHARAL